MTLDDVIVVTNNLDYASEKELEVVYVVGKNSTPQDIKLMRSAILELWRIAESLPYCTWYGLYGLQRGVLNIVAESRVAVWTEYDMDYAIMRGLNPVRFFTGYGLVLWSAEVRAFDKPLIQTPVRPSYTGDTWLTNMASVGTLKGRGVIFNPINIREATNETPAQHT